MLDERSKYLRRLIIRALLGGGRGHVGPSFSLVEILRVLYDDVIRPQDKVILSKGHGCLALYALLIDKGLVPIEELDRFCREGAMLGGHPEHHIPGVEVSTGSLGHGLSLGIGMALSSRMRKSDSKTYVIVGDGECDEGSIWEAALCAGKHKLSNLAVIVDYNKRQSYGTVEEVQPLEPMLLKWMSFLFTGTNVDGHDLDQLRMMGSVFQDKDKPRAIICHTVKGKGIPEVENHPFWHHKDTFTAEDAARLTAALDA